MTRWFVTLFMVVAVAVTMNNFYSAVSIDREVVASIETEVTKFIVLRNDKDSTMLAKRRHECGDLRSQIGEIDLDGDRIEYLISEGVIPRKCLVFVADSRNLATARSVILSVAGDFAIDYEEGTTRRWNDDAASIRFDILETENGSRFAIKTS